LKVLSFPTTRNTSKNISNKKKEKERKGDFKFSLMVMATCKTRKRSMESVGIKLESCGTSRVFFNKKDGEGGERGVARLERNGNVN
jgi:hypothetical protein